VRHEGEPVGGVRRYGVRAGGRGQLVEGRGADRAVRCDGMHRRAAALIIGAQQYLPVRSGARNVGACAGATVPSSVSPPLLGSIR